MLTLGRRINYVRKINKLNQVEFSKIIGVSQGTLSELETDKYKPSLEIIILIHRNFKVDLEWLLVDTNDITNRDLCLPKITGKEEELILLFRELSTEDQDEIIGIIELKLNRYKKGGLQKVAKF
ncbi:helix-turn-helix transcriptional regulator [Bacillus sp. FJAT-27251]|uniref:helix-turn-helix domain-containing protein n=1 Tax=Bacillus sp. FJAT-27251 TaxID=1684142 RepID=UPI0006A78390|nr:helix-turn-helix transcriptional regulator [Bacillus sp. FJAT-27251]